MESGNFAQIASALLSLITLAYVMLSARSKASNEAHIGLEKRVTATETLVASIRSDLMHMPDKEATHRLELRLAEIGHGWHDAAAPPSTPPGWVSAGPMTLRTSSASTRSRRSPSRRR